MRTSEEIKKQFFDQAENRLLTGKRIVQKVQQLTEKNLAEKKEVVSSSERRSIEDAAYFEILIELLVLKIRNSSTWSKLDGDELRNVIATLEQQILADVVILTPVRSQIANRAYSALRGFGLLDAIMEDDTITEVMINGPDSIFIEQNGKVRKIDQKYENEERLNDVIQRIVGISGRKVDRADPIVDTTLPDGSRVNVVLPPISLVGPILTVRKFSKQPMTIEKLLEYGSLTQEAADFLRILVECRYNIIISGGTGSGKTTFLNALSNFIPRDQRVITIEDSAELQIKNIPNLVRMLTRDKNASGSGQVTMTQLIRSSLRMRPDRIIVGEVRGAEALDMLQAMNTGHDGSISTGHANSTKDMLSRLETMVLQGAAGLPLPAIKQQIASAVDIIVHLSRLYDHSRKTMEICELVGLDTSKNQSAGGEYILNPLYRFEIDRSAYGDGQVHGVLRRTQNKMIKTEKLQMCGIWNEL